ncbi:unnamed protein product [Rhizophagus irregularis]|nr:unnamed protein product [Rhizophagus irregularis]
MEYDNGFGTHPRREFEIFSYIISGELQHKDSMGNVEILKRGDVNSQHIFEDDWNSYRFSYVCHTGGQLKINDGIILKPGDGAFITEVVNGEEFIFESVGKEAVEFVLFDLA